MPDELTRAVNHEASHTICALALRRIVRICQIGDMNGGGMICRVSCEIGPGSAPSISPVSPWPGRSARRC